MAGEATANENTMNTEAPAPSGVSEITVCDTCKFPDGEPVRNGLSAGATLLIALEDAMAALPEADRARLRLRPFSCLMNCSRSCSAAVACASGARSKVSYVLGDFEPGREAAEALIGYALGHANSENGVVPYKTWPQGVKGHFVARVPQPAEPAGKPPKF